MAKEKRNKSEKEKVYYFNVYEGELVHTFHMGEKEAREKYGDFTPDENDNVIIYENK